MHVRSEKGNVGVNLDLENGSKDSDQSFRNSNESLLVVNGWGISTSIPLSLFKKLLRLSFLTHFTNWTACYTFAELKASWTDVSRSSILSHLFGYDFKMVKSSHFTSWEAKVLQQGIEWATCLIVMAADEIMQMLKSSWNIFLVNSCYLIVNTGCEWFLLGKLG